jgi:hypothetical protein
MYEIETNKKDGFLYTVILFKDKNKFKKTLKSVNLAGLREVLFAGTTKEMMNQDGKIVIGSRVKFYQEQMEQFGEITSLDGYPYYEIKPDSQPRNRFSIHKRFVQSEVLSTQKLADIFIRQLNDGKFSHYEIGLLKLNDRVYRKSIDSLQNIATKGDYVMMIKSEYHS